MALSSQTQVSAGGRVAANDVWEIRIKFSVDGVGPLHGSIFVQDNGRGRGVDFSDENFDPAKLGDADCGKVSQFELEEVVQGSVTVRD